MTEVEHAPEIRRSLPIITDEIELPNISKDEFLWLIQTISTISCKNEFAIGILNKFKSATEHIIF